MHFINVILPLNLDKTFTYSVNVEEYKFLQPGMRVTVPFGKTKVYTALVVEKHTIPPELYEAKEISQIIDEVPIVNDIQLRHWQWIASYYMCSIGEVFKSALPSGLILESETIISSTHTESDKTLAEQIHPKFPFIKAEILWAVRNEMCMKVEDFLSRRTRALLLDAKAAIESASLVAEIMAREKNKNENWIKNEIDSFNSIAKNYLPTSNNKLLITN